MKFKQCSLVTLFCGLLFLTAGVIIPFVSLQTYTFDNGAMGIIGGNDTPTYKFLLFNMFEGLPFVLILLGACLIITAVFCLILTRTVTAHCNITTSAVSLGLSAVGALGLICAFIWFTIVSFHEMSKHPISYPVSVSLGVVCFFTFVALIAVYFIIRVRRWSVKGFIIDFFTSVVYLPTFFFLFSYLYKILS